MANSSPAVLGQILLEEGRLTSEQLADALAEQRGTRERLGCVLVRRGLEEQYVARALARQLRLPFAAAPLTSEPAALRLVDARLALRLQVCPLSISARRLRVAMADPLDAAAIDDLQFRSGLRVEPVVTTPSAVASALERAFPASEPGQATTSPREVRALLTRGAPTTLAVRERGSSPDELTRASEAPRTIALVDRILSRAVASRASDVHIEPASNELRVRARIDGSLRELLRVPGSAGAAAISRIKIMAGLDIAIKRKPQDGRGAVQVENRELGLRVSTLPTETGEKLVLRLLDPDNAAHALDTLGMNATSHARFARLLGRGHGVLLVTGPTGSGKTTTLYAALAALDRERRNVVTLEDPIEYRLPGLTQVQVHTRAGLTFATALRAVLRQDPDVIMIGEMRDRETVEVGMAAALTGHLVLSTLHTNDAPGAVARLVDMGAPPYLIAGGLIGVLAQRLARRLCPHCRVAAPFPAEQASALGAEGRASSIYHARGCARCEREGYHGRTGIFELLLVDGHIRELVLRRAGADTIRAAARSNGMQLLSADAWDKVESGLTSLDEVRPLLTWFADETQLPRCPCGGALQPEWHFCPGCGLPRLAAPDYAPGQRSGALLQSSLK